jgi:transcriptional regulator with XRE-family HTH domain
MATAKVNPAYARGARRLAAAIKKAGVDRQDLAKKLGVHYATLNNYCTGRSRPNPDMLAKLKTLLKLDAGAVAVIEALGPAQRAMALHAAHGRNSVQVLAPSRVPQTRLRQDHPDAPVPDPGVFGMEMKADGTMHVWVRATLPVDKGTALLRALLDMNIVQQKGETPGDDRDTQDTE